MIRRLKFGLASFFLAAVMLGAASPAAMAAPAYSGAGPGKLCPSEAGGWFVSPPSAGDTVVDMNGDGVICVKAVDGRGSSRDVPGFTVIDDLIVVD